MHFRCIGDEDTVTAFGLAGIDGCIAHDAGTAKAAWLAASADPECGVVIMTEPLAALISSELETWRIDHSVPLIALVPGGDADARFSRSASDYLRQAIGLRIEESTGP